MKTKTKNFQFTLTDSDKKFLDFVKNLKQPALLASLLLFSVIFTVLLPIIADKSYSVVYERLRDSGNLSNIGKIESVQAEEVDATDPDAELARAEFEAWNITTASRHVMTAYNSDPGQCDSTPCITANGFNVCKHGIEDTIAANFLPFGTKVRIPELFGERIFIVRDRMNKRYTSRVDIWMLSKEDARNFGVKVAKIEVLEQIE